MCKEEIEIKKRYEGIIRGDISCGETRGISLERGHIMFQRSYFYGRLAGGGRREFFLVLDESICGEFQSVGRNQTVF